MRPPSEPTAWRGSLRTRLTRISDGKPSRRSTSFQSGRSYRSSSRSWAERKPRRERPLKTSSVVGYRTTTEPLRSSRRSSKPPDFGRPSRHTVPNSSGDLKGNFAQWRALHYSRTSPASTAAGIIHYSQKLHYRAGGIGEVPSSTASYGSSWPEIHAKLTSRRYGARPPLHWWIRRG